MTHNPPPQTAEWPPAGPMAEWTPPQVDARIVELKRTARTDALAAELLTALRARHDREQYPQWWITPRGRGRLHAQQNCPSRRSGATPLTLLYPLSGMDLDEVAKRLGDVLCQTCVGEHNGAHISRDDACKKLGLEYGQPPHDRGKARALTRDPCTGA